MVDRSLGRGCDFFFLSFSRFTQNQDVEARVRLDVLAKTRMVDFAKEEFEKNGVEVPASLNKDRRAGLIAEFKTLSAKTAELRKVLDSAETVGRLKQQGAFTLEGLQAQFGITTAQVDDLLRFARFQFDAGNYGQAGEYLAALRVLRGAVAPDAVGALYGKLACDVLLQDWASAQEQLARLREALDSPAMAEAAALQLTHRTWLLHWALFVHFAQPDGAARWADLAMSDVLVNVLQTTSPHLLRYVGVAFVVSSQRRASLRDVVRVIEQERDNYSDAVTLFLGALYVDHDFEEALRQLTAAEALLRKDFFAHALVVSFVENARTLVFRSYLKIHQSIDLSLLSAKLGLANAADAESYIVNLIRNEQDAKIDSASNQIVFRTAASSVYQKIIERTQALATQTALLQAQLSRHRK